MAHSSAPGELPIVKRGSHAFNAWIFYWRNLGKRTDWYERRDTITVPTEYPPEVRT